MLIRFDPLRRAPEATELSQLQDAAQSTLRGKQALVVLDNVEPELPAISVVAPLRSAGLTLLLTARQTLPHTVASAEATRTLDLLRAEEALTLFISALGRTNADPIRPAERAAAERIVAALGNHTLAVKLAGAYAAAEGRDLEALARELGNAAGGLTLPGDDETPEAVRRTFALSLDTLPADAQQLFAGLAVFATPECGRQAALAVGRGLGQSHPEQSLHLLLTRALVDPSNDETLPQDSDRERLRMHPLLRALAEDLYHRWPQAEQDAAALVAAQYLANYAETHQTADSVLAADEGNLSGALEWAHAHDHPEVVVDLAHGMRKFWDVRGRYGEGMRYLTWAIGEADRHTNATTDDRRRGAELGLTYSTLLYFTGHVADGALVLQRSLAVFRTVHDRRGEGAALGLLGELTMGLGQNDAAE
ncbi:MAG: NB-ARC domain-containing protein, partial [Ktedonobacterales bacterium]